MSKNNLVFGDYKVSERKRTGTNPRVVFYLTPNSEKHTNIEDYSFKAIVAIRRGDIIERYPECFPNSLNDTQKLELIDHLKTRQNQLLNSKVTSKTQAQTADFDIFEDVLS
jgi:hypothetical protein